MDSSLPDTQLRVEILTIPLWYFIELTSYFSIDILQPQVSTATLCKSQEISDEITYNLQTIFSGQLSAERSSPYVHGKFLTLLGLQLHETQMLPVSQNPKIPSLIQETPHSFNKMREVEALIRQDWEHRYSLKDLAKIVGTNECYLKRDFKAFFGIPIHAYRLQQKMNFAQLQLLQTKQSIKSIAKQLGYKYTTHFTAAFRKYFHITPGELRKE